MRNFHKNSNTIWQPHISRQTPHLASPPFWQKFSDPPFPCDFEYYFVSKFISLEDFPDEINFNSPARVHYFLWKCCLKSCSVINPKINKKQKRKWKWSFTLSKTECPMPHTVRNFNGSRNSPIFHKIRNLRQQRIWLKNWEKTINISLCFSCHDCSFEI